VLRVVTALWHVAGLLLLLVLFLEFGVDWLRRGLRRLRHGRATKPGRSALADAYGGAEWPIAYFDEFNRSVRVDFAPHVGWWMRPFRGRFVTIDERGLRATPGEERAAPDATRILCLGGSTMFGMGARDEHTIPAALARRLGEDGHRVTVTNAGQLGFNSTQETIALQGLLKQGARPDIVVFYDGINEMMCAEQTGLPDHVMHEAPRHAEFNLLYTDRRVALLQAALITAMPRTVRRLRELTGLPLRGPLPTAGPDLGSADIERLATEVVGIYAANVRLVRLLAASYGFQAVFFWQPVITTKRVKTADELFFEAEFTRDVYRRREFFALVQAAYEAHPELRGASDTLDLSRLFDEHAWPLYIDLYHVTEPGNAAVAEAMLPALSAILPAPRRAAVGA